MNLKGVRFHLFESSVEPIFVKIKDAKTFTAADIQAVSDDFTILNPDHYITDIAKGTTLELELRLGIGKGYKSSEENKLNNSPVGMIPIDSIFNPVTQVAFNVSPLPGAKEDLTHGLRFKPKRLALRANSPAATTLRGLLVFVQLVMAAIITAPSGIRPSASALS